MSTPLKLATPSHTPPHTPQHTVWLERWCPPKPLVGVYPIEKMLNRHTFLVTPESRLVVAVIARAIGDCLCSGVRSRREARRFILGEDLTLWCDLVGLEPDFVRFVAKRAGYLAEEAGHWKKVPIKVAIPTQSKASTAGATTAATTSNPLGAPNHA